VPNLGHDGGGADGRREADAIDETAYLWHFYRRPDGRIQVEVDLRYHDQVLEAGNVFVSCGRSANWEEAA
jgi:hypothetical protein